MKILVYTFFGYHLSCSKVLYNLQETATISKYILGPQSLARKLTSNVSKYDYIVGIADHNKLAKKSRFDPLYINKKGKKTILEDNDEYFRSNLEIELSNNFYLFKSYTNGPCNRTGYLIMNKIISKDFKTKFGFFHLNKSNAGRDLEEILGKLQQTKKQ